MNDILVSVLMTAYNREEYIAKAIESVLASTCQNFELIIVDDHSTDKTLELAKEYEKQDGRIKVYTNDKNLGDYPNRNKAASYAKGKYIKYLDSDDIIYPHGLEVMVRSMEQFPEAGWGLCSVSDALRPYPVCISPQQAYWEHFNGYGFFNRAPGNSIILKSAFTAVGGFTGKRMIGDNELWLILARKFPLVKFQRDLVWDRVHAGQERRSDYAKKYGKLRKGIFEEAFRHPECPLNEQQKNEIRLKIKRKSLKGNLIETLKSLLGKF